MKWISITESYPEEYLDVLVLRKTGNINVGYWVFSDTYDQFIGDNCGWKICINSYIDSDEMGEKSDIVLDIDDVIYWMPLPELPKEPTDVPVL